jgi:hypothetical protein
MVPRVAEAAEVCQRVYRRNSMIPRVAVSSRGVPECWQEE